MAVIDSFLFGIPINPQTALISALLILLVVVLRKGQNDEKKKEKSTPKDKMKNTLDLMLERRTIMPKEFITEGKLSDEELDMILKLQIGLQHTKKMNPGDIQFYALHLKLKNTLIFWTTGMTRMKLNLNLENWKNSRQKLKAYVRNGPSGLVI